MTPLAHAIVSDSTLPIAKRRHGEAMQRLRLLDDVHFFDVSAVYEAACDLSISMMKTGMPPGRLAFLPAPRTWIEWTEGAGRCGALLEAQEGDPAASVTWAVTLFEDRRVRVAADRGWLTLGKQAGLNGIAFADERQDQWKRAVADARIYALLAMINTPRVIGRTTHQPHAGLQRKIAAARSMPGKYPLHAWHELKLEVQPPRDESGHEPRQTILTGGKALHFVRAYVRLQRGRIVVVSSHWKGDPALGIKRTRYRVMPPRRNAA